MSPRSFFPTGQRFPISNHVTSGSHEPTILFSNWSAVFTHLEPTILFSHWSAVSHLKPRDFRLYEPTILFSPLVSGFLHRKFLWSRDRSRPIRSQEICHTSPLYYFHCIVRGLRYICDAMLPQNVNDCVSYFLTTTLFCICIRISFS